MADNATTAPPSRHPTTTVKSQKSKSQGGEDVKVARPGRRDSNKTGRPNTDKSSVKPLSGTTKTAAVSEPRETSSAGTRNNKVSRKTAVSSNPDKPMKPASRAGISGDTAVNSATNDTKQEAMVDGAISTLMNASRKFADLKTPTKDRMRDLWFTMCGLLPSYVASSTRADSSAGKTDADLSAKIVATEATQGKTDAKPKTAASTAESVGGTAPTITPTSQAPTMPPTSAASSMPCTPAKNDTVVPAGTSQSAVKGVVDFPANSATVPQTTETVTQTKTTTTASKQSGRIGRWLTRLKDKASGKSKKAP